MIANGTVVKYWHLFLFFFLPPTGVFFIEVRNCGYQKNSDYSVFHTDTIRSPSYLRITFIDGRFHSLFMSSRFHVLQWSMLRNVSTTCFMHKIITIGRNPSSECIIILCCVITVCTKQTLCVRVKWRSIIKRKPNLLTYACFFYRRKNANKHSMGVVWNDTVQIILQIPCI